MALNPALAEIIAESNRKFRPSPREHAIEHIYEGLREAWEHKNTDIYQVAMDMLEWIEEWAADREPTGELIFINPNMPTGFIDPDTAKIDPVS